MTSDSTTAKNAGGGVSYVDSFEGEDEATDDVDDDDDLDVDTEDGEVDDGCSTASASVASASDYRRRNQQTSGGGRVLTGLSRSRFSRDGTPISLQEASNVAKVRASTISKVDSRKVSTNPGSSVTSNSIGGGFLRNLSMRFSRRYAAVSKFLPLNMVYIKVVRQQYEKTAGKLISVIHSLLT